MNNKMLYIKTYEEFNGPNLDINYNIEYDFFTYQSKKFDGGDGINAMEIPRKFKQNVDNPIYVKGNNARKKQKERKERIKKYSKEARIAKMMDFQTDDDFITFAPRKEPTVDA